MCYSKDGSTDTVECEQDVSIHCLLDLNAIKINIRIVYFKTVLYQQTTQYNEESMKVLNK